MGWGGKATGRRQVRDVRARRQHGSLACSRAAWILASVMTAIVFSHAASIAMSIVTMNMASVAQATVASAMAAIVQTPMASVPR